MEKIFIALIWMLAISMGTMADNGLNIVQIEVEKEQKGGSAHVWVHFPVDADSPVRRAVISYIFQCMLSFSNADIDYPSDTCDEEEFKTFLDSYTDSVSHACAIDQQEYAASCAESGIIYEVSWFRNFSILKVAETDRYVSYA